MPAPPTRKLAVLACMDARLDPAAELNLKPGEAHVIRNAGGLATDDAIRSLAVSQRRLGTEQVAVIHHTDCGMLGFSDEEFKGELAEETGERPGWAAYPLAEVEQGLRESVARIQASPFLLHTDSVRGYIFDVDTGELREVE